ncbi:MAG: hypothetical protein IJ194_06570 [Bacilli bacterium]|nr:hypothetical protein [Bacilli bacterium]
MTLSPETLNSILLIVFVAMIALTLLAGLIGFIKGVYKTTVKTLIKVVFILVAIFLCPSIATFIGNFDISPIIQSSEPVTLLYWMADQLTSSGVVSPINGLSLYETAVAIASSLATYVVFFILMVLLQLLSSLLTTIFYHAIFRWFLPVETKKDRKAKKENKENYDATSGLLNEEGKPAQEARRKLPLLRIPGGIIGAVQEFLFVLILLTPITSLARTALSNRSSVEEAMVSMDIPEDKQSLIKAYMDKVENSTIYQLQGLFGLDMVIMEKVSTITLNNTSLSFNTLANSTLDVAKPLINERIITYDQGVDALTINLAQLLSVSTMDTLISSLIENDLLMALFPTLVDVALNTLDTNAAIDLNALSFEDVDWKSELTIINGIYKKVYASFFGHFVESGMDMESFKIPTSTMSEEDIEEIISALENLGTMEIVKRNLPTLFSSLGKYFENFGVSLFSTDPNAYSSIDWSKDLSIIGDVILHFFKTLELDISASILESNEITDVTFHALSDDIKRNEISVLLCGDENRLGLVDTQLFSTLSIADTLESTLGSIPSIESYVKEANIAEAFENFTIFDYKREIRNILEIAGMVFSEDSKINLEDVTTFDIFDEESANQLGELLATVEKSVVFKRIYPSVLKSFLFSNTFDFSNYLFGLTPYNFDYESDDFISNFKEILTLMPKVKETMDLFRNSEKSAKDKLMEFDLDFIQELLTIITTSNFFNSDVRMGISSSEQKNMNIYTLLSNLFSVEPFVSMGIKSPTLEELQDVKWRDENNEKGEISLIISVLQYAKDNAAFLVDPEHDLATLGDSKEISSLLRTGLQSKILSPSILSIIDSSLNDYMEQLGIHISLNRMRNSMWLEDVDHIGEIFDLILTLDLGSLDFQSIDPDRLNALLTNLNKCNFVQVSSDYEDPFGYQIYQLLNRQNFFSLFSISHPDIYAFNLTNSDKSWSEEEATIQIDGKDFSVTTKGEIADLIELIHIAQGFDFENMKDGKLPTGFISEVATHMDSYLLVHLFSQILVNTSQLINLGENYSKVMTAIDFHLLTTMTKEEITSELSLIDYLYSLTNEKVEDVSKLEYMMSHLYSLNTIPSGEGTLLDEFNTLLDKMGASILMNTKKEGALLTPLQELFYSTISTLNISSMITLEEEEEYQDGALRGLLNSILEMDEEISHFKSILCDIQGMDATSFDFSTMSKDGLILLLKDMNRSTLFHRLPISMMERALKDIDIDSLLVIPETGEISYPIETKVHLTTSLDDILYWDNELENMVELALGDDGLKEFFQNKDSLSTLSLDGFHLRFLYYLGKMKTFKYNRSYIFYNLMLNNSSQEVAKSLLSETVDAPYGEDKHAYTLERIFFSNPKLLDGNGELDQEKAYQDLDMVEKVLYTLLENTDDIQNATSILDIHLSFATLLGCGSKVENNIYYRSDFASELLSGILDVLFHNPTIAPHFPGVNTLDFKAQDYFLINDVEGRAIDGIVLFANTTPTIDMMTFNAYYLKDQLLPLLPYYGTKNQVYTEAKDIARFDYYLNHVAYSANGNSKIALLAQSVILQLPVHKTSDNTYPNIGAMTTLNLNTSSFEEVIQEIAPDIE